MKREGVWFEVTNLVVPTYTDKPEMIRRMCDWLLENLGPDYPLHFSRFHPAHKLTHLPPTPVDTLLEARDIARSAGLHFVYVGNCQEVPDGETTFCPGCKKPLISRNVFSVLSNARQRRQVPMVRDEDCRGLGLKGKKGTGAYIREYTHTR